MISASCLLQCRPHLSSVKFENLVQSCFRNENSTLEINMSHFGVLHCHQWQPPTSASESIKWLDKNCRYLFASICQCFSKNTMCKKKSWQKGMVCTDLLIRQILQIFALYIKHETAWGMVTKSLRDPLSCNFLHVPLPSPYHLHVSPRVSSCFLV